MEVLYCDAYIYNLDELVEKIINNQEKENTEFEEIIFEIFRNITGIKTNSLVIYGEQADPPIIKNTGKSILSQLISEKLKERGISSLPIHCVLYNDIFGSNESVFKELKLLSKRAIKEIGNTTYAFGKLARKQVENYINNYFDSFNLDEFGIKIENLYGKSIGKINIILREKIENKILPYKVKRCSLSELEKKIIGETVEYPKLRKILNMEERQNLFYVTWKINGNYRRCPVIPLFRSEKCRVVLPWNMKEELFVGEICDILSNENCVAASLNAAGRAAMIYSLTSKGVHITGGGSTYNNKLSYKWKKLTNKIPLLTYISNKKFRENSVKPLYLLLNKKDEISKILENADEINSTNHSCFEKLVEGIK